MSVNPNANGGLLLQPLDMPDFRDFAVKVDAPGATEDSATTILGNMLEDVMRRNLATRNFRMFAPDENASNRLQAVYKASGKRWEARDPAGRRKPLRRWPRHGSALRKSLRRLARRLPAHRTPRVLLLLRGLHPHHRLDVQPARQVDQGQPHRCLGANLLLRSTTCLPRTSGGRTTTASLTRTPASSITSPTKRPIPSASISRRTPTCLLSVADHCLRSRNYVNLIIAGKQPSPQWLNIDDAVRHCIAGVGEWEWASNSGDPEVVMACAGDVPTLETMAAVTVLREWAPDLRLRVVNVVDLFTLETFDQHPHGIENEAFDRLFTVDKPVIFAFHGYPTVVHKLTYKRHNHNGFHIHGYKEEGTTTTPFDMTVLNGLDRYTLALDALKYIPRFQSRFPEFRQRHSELMQQHKLYVSEHGEDMPEVRNWKWSRR